MAMFASKLRSLPAGEKYKYSSGRNTIVTSLVAVDAMTQEEVLPYLRLLIDHPRSGASNMARSSRI